MVVSRDGVYIVGIRRDRCVMACRWAVTNEKVHRKSVMEDTCVSEYIKVLDRANLGGRGGGGGGRAATS